MCIWCIWGRSGKFTWPARLYLKKQCACPRTWHLMVKRMIDVVILHTRCLWETLGSKQPWPALLDFFWLFIFFKFLIILVTSAIKEIIGTNWWLGPCWGTIQTMLQIFQTSFYCQINAQRRSYLTHRDQSTIQQWSWKSPALQCWLICSIIFRVRNLKT